MHHLLQFHWSITSHVNLFKTVCISAYLRREKVRVKFPTFNALLLEPLHYVIFSKHSFDVSAILEKYFAYVVIALIYSKQRFVVFPFPSLQKALATRLMTDIISITYCGKMLFLFSFYSSDFVRNHASTTFYIFFTSIKSIVYTESLNCVKKPKNTGPIGKSGH